MSFRISRSGVDMTMSRASSKLFAPSGARKSGTLP